MSNMISQYHIIYSPDITMKKNGSNVCVCVCVCVNGKEMKTDTKTWHE